MSRIVWPSLLGPVFGRSDSFERYPLAVGTRFLHGRNPRLLKLRISMQAGRPAVFAGLFDGRVGHAPFAVRPALAPALPVPL